jgi:hypothetical protein
MADRTKGGVPGYGLATEHIIGHRDDAVADRVPGVGAGHAPARERSHGTKDQAMEKSSRDDDYPRRAAMAIAACALAMAVAIWLVVAAGVQPSAGPVPPASERDGGETTMVDAASGVIGFDGVAAR